MRLYSPRILPQTEIQNPIVIQAFPRQQTGAQTITETRHHPRPCFDTSRDNCLVAKNRSRHTLYHYRALVTIPSRQRFNGFLRKKLTRIVVKHASAVTTVTGILAKAMQNHGLLNDNYIVLPNVVDFNKFKPIPHHNEIPKIVHVSCFENKSKNITGLIDALCILETKNIDYQCVLIGEGIDFKLIKDYSKKLKHQERIRFTGILEGQEYIDELASSDFLVLPSNYETQGVVLLEAFACGIPVVSTKVGGIPEIVNESNGILVPPHDSEKLADAMQKMIASYQNYNSNALRDNIIKKFSNESIGKLLNDIYEKTLKP